MAVLFISDLHLTPEKPEIAFNLMQFMQTANQYEAIYILGDLFEFWLGDDFIPEALQPLIQGLQQLTSAGIPVYFIQGNRDFLVGEDFMKLTGCRLLPESTVIEYYGHRILVMHGDTLCTDDIEYQQFRAHVRDPERQKQFLSLPIEARIHQAGEVKKNIRETSAKKSDEIMDVNPTTVLEQMKQNDVAYLIHGHTHRPAIHQYNHGWRAVIGDWQPQPSWLILEKSGITLHDPRVSAAAAVASF